MKIFCAFLVLMMYYELIAMIMDVLAELPAKHIGSHVLGFVLYGSWLLVRRHDAKRLWSDLRGFLR